MNIKRNIIALESRKRTECQSWRERTHPYACRVYASQRIGVHIAGYRIDVAKWDADKQRVKNGCTNKPAKLIRNQCGLAEILWRDSKRIQGI